MILPLHQFVPPAILSFYLKNFKSYGYFGNYHSWQEASGKASGYESDKIFEKVKSATLEVLHGRAEYEKDSILFYESSFNWPVISYILKAAAEMGRVDVIDFGGALGSIYFQHKKLLNQIPHSWHIVEQKKFVDIGQELFQNDHLNFHYSVNEVIEKRGANFFLSACVIQYLENPYAWLDTFVQLKLPYILIDRVPFTNNDTDRITLQKTNKKIYQASYPAWFFSKSKFLEHLGVTYDLIWEYSCNEFSNIDGRFEGLVFKLKNLD